MSWARIASAAQLAAAVAVILRILFASADPIAYTDEQTYDQTTYTMPISSTENDTDVYRGKSDYSIRSSNIIVFPDGSKNFLLFLFISYIVTTNDKLINNDEYFFPRFMFHFSFFFFRFKRFDFAQKKLQTTFSPSLELEADCFR